MRVSAKAQYACIAMLELAGNYQEPQLLQVKTQVAASIADEKQLASAVQFQAQEHPPILLRQYIPGECRVVGRRVNIPVEPL